MKLNSGGPDRMRQQLPLLPAMEDETVQKARRVVALSVPQSEVVELLDMLGIR